MSSATQGNEILWNVESLRFTAFFQPGTDVKASGWWKHVVAEAPESRVEKPREGLLREEGPLLGGRLTLSADPLRVDWVLAGNVNNVFEKGTFEALPRYDDCVSPFSKLVKRWIELKTPVVRMAWGSVLLGPVDNREQGYRRIARYLPHVTIDSVGSSDFQFQINRPRNSKTKEQLKINRLSKWSVGLFQSGTLQLAPLPEGVGARTGIARTSGPSLHACRLELDINTAAEYTEPFASELCLTLLDELVSLATEISQRGDSP